MRFEVGFDESPLLDLADIGAITLARRNCALAARVLTLDQFGFLVTEWNELDHDQRERRHDYCVVHHHRYVISPYPGRRVCNRCLDSYEEP